MNNTPMPPRIAKLDKDSRGYPIPWLVLRNEEGFPFFTVNDEHKRIRAIIEQICPICGERLGRWKYFIGGPRSAFDPNGVYYDTPTHRDCGNYALAVCPYLAMPRYLGRVDLLHKDKLPKEAITFVDPTQIPERPEIFVVVIAAKILPIGPYIRPVEIGGYEFWRHGQQLTKTKALPFLRAVLGEAWEIPQ